METTKSVGPTFPVMLSDEMVEDFLAIDKGYLAAMGVTPPEQDRGETRVAFSRRLTNQVQCELSTRVAAHIDQLFV